MVFEVPIINIGSLFIKVYKFLMRPNGTFKKHNFNWLFFFLSIFSLYSWNSSMLLMNDALKDSPYFQVKGLSLYSTLHLLMVISL